MKKLLIILLTALLAISFAACQNDGSTDSSDTSAAESKAETSEIALPEINKSDVDLTGYSPCGTEGAEKIIITLADFGEAIPDGQFSAQGITHVYIEDGITSIGNGCFADCEKLEAVRLPETLKSIGTWDSKSGAFENCSALREIYIPAGVTAVCTPFRNSGLKRIILAEGMTAVNIAVAFGGTAPEEIILPSSLKAINMTMPFETLQGETVDTSNLKPIYLPDNLETVCIDYANVFYLTENSVTHQTMQNGGNVADYHNGETLTYTVPSEQFKFN